MRVKVLLNNRWAKFEAPKETLRALRAFWSFYPSRWVLENSPKHQAWLNAVAEAAKEGIPASDVEGWDGRISPFAYNRIPAGLFRATWRQAKAELQCKFEIVRTYMPKLEFKTGLEPAQGKYRFHNKCADKMVAALPYGGGIILAATGAGKTALAARLFSRVSANCIFISDQKKLLHQNQQELADWLKEPIGLVGDSELTVQRVTAATIQTLQALLRRRALGKLAPEVQKWLSTPVIAFVDELHEQLNDRTKEYLRAANIIAVYGMTATLNLDIKANLLDAHSIAGPVVFKYSLERGVKSGVLTVGSAIQLIFPQRMISNNAGLVYAADVMENPVKLKACKAIAQILHDNNRYTVMFAGRLPHIKLLCETVHPIPHRRVDGTIDKEMREKSLKSFEAGKIRLLVSSRVSKKGVNFKRADVVVDWEEARLPENTAQKYGRLTRLHVDKRSSLYVDVATGGKKLHAGTRLRALRKLGIAVERHYVSSAAEAADLVRQALEKL